LITSNLTRNSCENVCVSFWIFHRWHTMSKDSHNAAAGSNARWLRKGYETEE
jgi:hypothetical protein